MILSYSKKNIELYNFKVKIINLIKIHSIRFDYPNRWKSGSIIHHSSGLRTKFYDCFSVGKCYGLQPIVFDFNCGSHSCIITIDNKRLDDDKVKLLSINDGFDNKDDFIDYFYETSLQVNKPELEMKIIHFTDFKY